MAQMLQLNRVPEDPEEGDGNEEGNGGEQHGGADGAGAMAPNMGTPPTTTLTFWGLLP